MTKFAAAAAKLSAAVDSVFGEAFLYQPMAFGSDVNARSGPDLDRPAMTIMASLRDSFARADSGPARMQGVVAERPGHASTRPQLSFDPAALPYAAQRGDRVTRIADGKVYQLAELRQAEGRSRIDADLNRM